MLGHSTYYNKLVKTYITYFGQIFNNISIQRSDVQSGNTLLVNVPIEYSPREKSLVRSIEYNDLNRRDVALVTPMITYSLLTLDYDRDRATPSTNKVFSQVDSNGNVQYTFKPVPYNITFDLNILVSNEEDGLMIVEQILPFFTPDFTARLYLQPFDQEFAIPVSLVATALRDTFEGAPGDIRYMIWSLSFVMKGWLIGPTQTGGVITNIDINMYNSTKDIYNTLTINAIGSPLLQKGDYIYQGNSYVNTAAGFVYSSNSSTIIVEAGAGTFQNYTTNNNLLLYKDNVAIGYITATQPANVVNEIISINTTSTTITEN